MTQEDLKKEAKKKYSMIGGLWLHRKNGAGTQFLKIQIRVENREVNAFAWPNKRKNHPNAPDFLIYVPAELSE
jgi:hypothetical protein